MSLIKPPGLKIKVRVGGQVVDAELMSTNKKTVWVKLPDGEIVKRNKERDLL